MRQSARTVLWEVGCATPLTYPIVGFRKSVAFALEYRDVSMMRQPIYDGRLVHFGYLISFRGESIDATRA